VIEHWLEALVETPGLTSVPREEARRVHVEESLAALEVVRSLAGPIVDVGSGGGAPGIPLAVELPDRAVTLLEASRRKCAFLERWARELPNVAVVCGRAEEQPVDAGALPVAKALAPPPVAAEWCLPLGRPGGRRCSTSARRRGGAGSRRWRSCWPRSSSDSPPACSSCASSGRRRRASRAARRGRKRPLA
jgi:16S rRNA (guanine(527)-N(7))-methyltransferase RsmG